MTWGLPSAVLVVACVALERFFVNYRLFKVLGDCSYSVYLLHVLVLSAGGYLAQRYALNPYAVLAVCVVIIGLSAMGSYRWLEQGSYRVLKGWFDGDERSNLSRQKH